MSVIDFNVQEIIDEANAKIKQNLTRENQISSDMLGLDNRCGYCWLTEDGLVVDSYAAGRFDYYGGFEYIDKEDRNKVGDYVIYDRWADRVDECYDHYFCREEEVA